MPCGGPVTTLGAGKWAGALSPAVARLRSGAQEQVRNEGSSRPAVSGDTSPRDLGTAAAQPLPPEPPGQPGGHSAFLFWSRNQMPTVLRACQDPQGDRHRLSWRGRSGRRMKLPNAGARTQGEVAGRTDPL
ncbi:hypothetical protein Celaphus_00004877 [Cervus elaphus hippelaphus]|uniref:Uncharacterized protein n=1 Tax=Cervus elaphus hippelaphus TaxID=46360 RepID=A0A212DDQ2_CEREH|nr:hypothetical protein Celaphus_00004877 [Cervus elaphus hippelaphus]